VNIAYGSYYLRYLLDHYGGNKTLALAAYNGGVANVDRWVADARAHDQTLAVSQIPFPETRDYVRKVLTAQQDYRKKYATQLGYR
jgi:soluble lytic murein transglycosylase